MNTPHHAESGRATKVEELVYDHPLHLVLMSMPGNGIRTTARLLTELSGKRFASAAHLASYAGLAPVTRLGDLYPR